MKSTDDYKIKAKAIPKKEAKVMVESLKTMPIYQSLKAHCERKKKQLLIVFEKNETRLKCD